jgi:hypothetical protein
MGYDRENPLDILARDAAWLEADRLRLLAERRFPAPELRATDEEIGMMASRLGLVRGAWEWFYMSIDEIKRDVRERADALVKKYGRVSTIIPGTSGPSHEEPEADPYETPVPSM